MAKRAIPPVASDDEVRVLLDRYRCPVPFHAVRTRFLGSIASPGPDASPLRAVEALWGGTLPALDNLDAVNELLGALMMGLWNRLTRHQEPSAPFRLTRQDTPASREGLAALARLRREELEGFIAGLYGDQEGIDVPERADKALDVLAELRAMVHATQVLAEDASKPAEPGEIAVTIRQFRELTRIAEHEMHEVVLSCTRARRQMMPTRPARRPTVH